MIYTMARPFKGRSMANTKAGLRRKRQRRLRKTATTTQSNRMVTIPGNTFRQAIPEKYKTVLNYTQNRSITFTVLNINSINTFRLNDLFDPDYTSTGHQSKYRDQLYVWYQYARCIGYKIYMRVFSDSNQPMSVGFGPSGSDTILSHDSFLEDKRTKKNIVTLNNPCRFYSSSYVDKHIGNKPGTWASESQYLQSSAAILAAPTSCWFHISCQRILASPVENNNLYFQISIKQYVQFQQPFDVGQS